MSDSSELLKRVKLSMMAGLDASLKKKFRVQQAAADALGIERHRLSYLRNGDFERFSVTWLILTAERVGANVTVTIE